MESTATSINKNDFEVTVGLKVKELATGRIAKVVVVDKKADEVWMISGSMTGVFRLSVFCEYFKKV